MMGVTVNIDRAEVILGRRHLDLDGEMMLAEEIVRTTDPYVPMQTGMLKNTVRITQTSGGTQIHYTQPYARAQYYGGRAPGTSDTGPLRGRYWFERSKADHKSEWIEMLKRYGEYTNDLYGKKR